MFIFLVVTTLAAVSAEDLVPLPLYAATWLVMHESLHAAAAKAEGRDIQNFKPYPHKYEGRWVFGEARYSGSYSLPAMVAPYVFDMAAFAALGLLSTEAPPGARPQLLAIMTCATLDIGINLIGTARGHGDLAPYRGAAMALGTAAVVAMGFHIATRP